MPASSHKNEYYEARTAMVREQLLDRGISDPKVLGAMHRIPRHKLVHPEFEDKAYHDRPLPIGFRQTISQPYIVAYMVEAAKIKEGDKILEIGTGSGYQTAVLAEIAASVYSVEIVKELATQTIQRLQKLNYINVHIRTGDGHSGWPEAAPFDAILVSAAPESIPAPLTEQLAEGGKLVIPVGKTGQMQSLMLLQKINGQLKKTELLPVRFVPFTRE